MSVYLPDNKITVPELWYPGRKPTVPVKINKNHPLLDGMLFCSIFNEYIGQPTNIVDNSPVTAINQAPFWIVSEGARCGGRGGYDSNKSQPALSVTDNYFWHIFFKIDNPTTATSCFFGNRYDGVQSPLQFFKITPSRVEYYNGGTSNNNVEYGTLTSGYHSISAIKNNDSLTVIVDGDVKGSKSGIPGLAANPVYIGTGDDGGVLESTEITAIMAMHGRMSVSVEMAKSLHHDPYKFLEAA